MFLTLVTFLSLFQMGLQCSSGRWTKNLHNNHSGLLRFLNASSGPSYYHRFSGNKIFFYLASDCNSPQTLLKIEFIRPDLSMDFFN
jgi:hypothetical protein